MVLRFIINLRSKIQGRSVEFGGPAKVDYDSSTHRNLSVQLLPVQ